MSAYERNDNQGKKEPFAQFIHKMDRLFSERPPRGMLQSLDGFFGSTKEQPYPFHLHETDQEYILTAILPGIPRDHISIDLLPQSVTISTKVSAEKRHLATSFSKIEKSASQLTKTLSFPKPIDEKKVRASHRDGVLTLHLPKIKGNRIEIND